METGEFRILNDRIRDRFAKVVGNRALEKLSEDVFTFPVGSQYTDITTGLFYVRMGVLGVVSDWVFPQKEHSFSNDFNEDYSI